MNNSAKSMIKQINRLVQAGYDQFRSTGRRAEQTIAACDHWLAAWELVKPLAGPNTRTGDEFDTTFPDLSHPLDNWLGDLEMELHNAGLSQRRYFEARIHFVHEYLTHFSELLPVLWTFD